ncbi:MAG: GNAT family N-acetyltransferase [Lachnospiraceae bacterium]|nr:GNAT family N-acetyltransferase [Lachnospiraceae bacterium]MBR6151911.1 GNAT family N-acetyltransferase [Lachnospiraceae bacterium]
MNENDYSKILIETKDLIMKKGEFDDWKPLYRNICSRDESAKYMLWKVTKSEEEAKERMVRTMAYQHKEKYALLVYQKVGMEPIGFVAMREREPMIYEEMGIAIGPEFVGKGYGKQILNALCMEAKVQGAKEFRASYREKNLASKALLNACGFEFDFMSEEKTDPRNGELYLVVNVKKVL